MARALLDASLEILSKVGADGLSLREAARRVGVNHRAVYRYYEDKRALLAAIAEAGYRALGADARAAVAAAAAQAEREQWTEQARCRAALIAVAEAYLRFAQREPARYLVMFGPRLNIDERFPTLEAAIRDVVAVLLEELARAGPHAASRVRRDAGISLWSSMHGLTSLVLAGRIPLRETRVHAYVTSVMAPVVDGILALLARTEP